MDTGNQPVDRGLMQRFRDSALRFNAQFARLTQQRNDVSRFPALQSDYNKLISEGSNIRNSIRAVTGGIDNVVGWFNNLFGSRGQAQLNAWPALIPVAVVVASMAALGKWAENVYLFERRLTESKRLEELGMPPQDAADVAAGRATSGWMKTIIVPLTVITLGWLFLRNEKK